MMRIMAWLGEPINEYHKFDKHIYLKTASYDVYYVIQTGLFYAVYDNITFAEHTNIDYDLLEDIQTMVSWETDEPISFRIFGLFIDAVAGHRTFTYDLFARQFIAN